MKRIFCPYCHGNTFSNSYGNCNNCGAPRPPQSKPKPTPTRGVENWVWEKILNMINCNTSKDIREVTHPFWKKYTDRMYFDGGAINLPVSPDEYNSLPVKDEFDIHVDNENCGDVIFRWDVALT